VATIFPKHKSTGGWVSAPHRFSTPSGCNAAVRFPPLVWCPHCYDGRRQAGWHLPCTCVCACVRACACVSGGVTGGEERWDGGKPERGCWGTGAGGALCFLLSFSAGFGGFSLLVSLSVSLALLLSQWFTEFCIVNSWPLCRRFLGGKVGMGLTERRTVQAAGIST